MLAVVVYAGGGPVGARRLPTLDCGNRQITSDVRLTADLTCPEPFFVAAQDAGKFNVDLGGHMLTIVADCPDDPLSWYFYCSALGNVASVSNGTLGGDISRPRRVSRVEVRGHIIAGLGALIERSTVVDGQIAIIGGNVTVRDNRLLRSFVWINDVDAGVGNATVTGNRISDAPGPGIDVHNSWVAQFTDMDGVIAHNTVTGSRGPAISVHGVFITLGRLEIRDNTLRDNVGDGIRIDMSWLSPPYMSYPVGPIVLEGNHLKNNGGHGVNADLPPLGPGYGVQDGGHNHARGNALDPQCVGVTCAEGRRPK
jgi:hypothetical protein